MLFVVKGKLYICVIIIIYHFETVINYQYRINKVIKLIVRLKLESD